MSEDTNIEPTDEKLYGFVTRIENLEEIKKGVSDDIKDVYGELKSQGYNPKMVKQLIKLRKIEAAKRKMEEAELTTYKCAIGLE